MSRHLFFSLGSNYDVFHVIYDSSKIIYSQITRLVYIVLFRFDSEIKFIIIINEIYLHAVK